MFNDIVGMSITTNVLFNNIENKEKMSNIMCRLQDEITKLIDEKFNDNLVANGGTGSWIQGIKFNNGSIIKTIDVDSKDNIRGSRSKYQTTKDMSVNMTNADKIRAMTDEELAEWIDKFNNEYREDWDSLGCCRCMYYRTHHYPNDCGDCEWKNGIIGWLKQENK